MSRCFYLSAGGDPFLADFVLSLWKEKWYDEVDVGYVGYNNHAEVPVDTAYEFLRKWEKDPKVRIIYTPFGVGNGTPITQMLLNSKEDRIMLLEDDSFIFTPGIVDSWMRKVTVIGSPRYTVGEVAEAAQKKYNLDYSGVGDKGFGWWPSFFICNRRDLLNTDLDFGSKKYPKGERFKELDHTFENDDYTDTFTWASIQLRYMGLVSEDIPQNHAHPYDLEFATSKQGMFANGNPQYIHGGSLSSGWGGYLNKWKPPVTTDMEKQDIETRVAFWLVCYYLAKTDDYVEFSKLYKEAIDNLIKNCNLNEDKINLKFRLYSRLMNLTNNR